MDDDWDLQALVRSCAGTTTSAPATTTSDPDHQFDFCCKKEHLSALPDPRTSFEEELHDLYKPFFLRPCSSATPSQATDPVRASVSSPSPNSLCFSRDLPDELQSHPLQVAAPASSARALTAPVSFTTTRSSQQSRSKRRKNLVKKVKHVDADELSSDVWSWRKYGQKPIKGSPYPRGYYRCSSSKGCLARKQVERNRSDPGKFIVTYTGEHNHPVPTHRNSLAGSTRQKLPTTASPPKPCCSSPSSSAEELAAESPGKLESGPELGDLMEDDVDDGEFGLSDMTVSDDFFAGLEELTGPVSVDSFPGNFVLPWAAMAGGRI